MQHNKNPLPFVLKLTIILWVLRFLIDVVLLALIGDDYNEAITLGDLCGMILVFFTYTQVIRLVLRKTNAVDCLMCGMFVYVVWDVGSFSPSESAIIKLVSILACMLDISALLCLLSKSAKAWVQRNKCVQTKSHSLLIGMLNCLLLILLAVFVVLLFLIKGF